MKNYVIGSFAGIRAGFVCNPFEFVKHRQQFQEELKQVKTHSSNHAQKALKDSSKTAITPQRRICHWQQSFGHSGLYKNNSNFGCLPYKPYSDNFIILPYFYGFVNGLQPQRKAKNPVVQRIINVNNWNKVRSFYDTAILPTFWGTFICGAVNDYPLYISRTQFRLQQSVGKYADIYRHYCKSLWSYLSSVISTLGFASQYKVPHNFIGSSSQLAFRSTDMILQYEIFQKSALLTYGVSRLLNGIVTVGAMGPVDSVTKRLLFSQGYEGNPHTNQMRRLSLHYINWTNAYSLVKPGFAKSFYWNICGIAKRIAMG